MLLYSMHYHQLAFHLVSLFFGVNRQYFIVFVPCRNKDCEHVDCFFFKCVRLLCDSETGPQRGLKRLFSCLVAPKPHSPSSLISAVGSNPI